MDSGSIALILALIVFVVVVIYILYSFGMIPIIKIEDSKGA